MRAREQVLAALREAGDFVSGEGLAAELGVTRAAVWKHIAALKKDGHRIEGRRSRGYRLEAEAECFDGRRLAELLTTTSFGRRLVVHASTGSTNSDAAALGRDGAEEGLVVIADEQSAGRGRLGRSWESRPGRNLYMSLLLRPDIAPAAAPQLALLAGIAVAEAAEGCGCDCGIKWPNDVVTPSMRKLAGLLAEMEAETDRVSFVVLGIGVNLNATMDDFPPELRDKATSLLVETGQRVDRAAFSAALLAALERLYTVFCEQGFAAIAAAWRARSVLEGREVDVLAGAQATRGRCVGIDEDGALLVETAAGRQRVLAGDVTLQGGYSNE